MSKCGNKHSSKFCDCCVYSYDEIRSEEYIDKAKKFFNTSNSLYSKFNSAKIIAYLAIAEYTANREGFTIYKEFDGQVRYREV